ncbi:extracellular solute-binding protein [Endozoicomonas numazuensis]|uniref:extracellular solute-binding protein n=1 Tax=Endozoicomonas numazuensis TaxID=1137799 RepID=UPI000691C0D9|nr:extracellular solute-binding protein [Endozoicomonas numazuensis]
MIKNLLFSFCATFSLVAWSEVHIQKSFTLIGTNKYPDHFTHFAYTNPYAPKGGLLRLARTGSFDTLNPLSHKGTAPDYMYYTYGTLLTRSADEPHTLYPFLAEAIEYPDDFSWVAFHINPKATFSDHHPVTSQDVVFTFELLKKEGSPFLKNLYKDIVRVEQTSRHRVIFHLEKPSKKQVALVGYMRILPHHYWHTRNFHDRQLDSPVTSGPLVVKNVKMGHNITFERIKDYWAENLPSQKGRYNFDEIRVDYYRDHQAVIEGFRAGLYDVYQETDINRWRQSFNFPAVREGRVLKKEVETLYPSGMSAIAFNLRREKFKKPELRKALIMAFDFEWLNSKLLNSDYQRTRSFFSNSPLSATGLPAKEELKLLRPFQDQLPKELFEQAISLPVSDGSGTNRDNKRKALSLFKKAGYQLKNGKMIEKDSGKPLTLNLITDDPKQERLLLSYSKSLADLGINLNIQSLDKSLFRKRVREFDFELVDWYFWQSTYPGTELYHMWSSQVAMEKQSGNIAGINNPVVDYLLAEAAKADNYETLTPIIRALDRVLMWGHYVIPKWHTQTTHLAYWDHLDHPSQDRLYWLDLNNWWYKPPAKDKNQP